MKIVKNVAVSAILGTATYFLIQPLAFTERGYNAIGGEVFLAVMVGLGYLYYKAEVER